MPITLGPEDSRPSNRAVAGSGALDIIGRQVTAGLGALKSTPLLTRIYVGLVLLIHALASVTAGADAASHAACFTPSNFLSLSGIWHAVVAPLYHASWWHVLLNVAAAVGVFGGAEKRLGSLATAHLAFIVLPIVNGIIHWAASGVLFLVWGSPSECAVGFSGVLFALISARCVEMHKASNGGASFDVFGVVRVPVLAYPWVLVIAAQLLVPNASWLGHVAGIASGVLLGAGLLAKVSLPDSIAERAESSSFGPLRRVLDSTLYIQHDPATALPRYGNVPSGPVERTLGGTPAARATEGLIIGAGGIAGALGPHGSTGAAFTALADDDEDALLPPGGTLHDATADAGSLRVPPPGPPADLARPTSPALSASSSEPGSGSPLQLAADAKDQEAIEKRLLI